VAVEYDITLIRVSLVHLNVVSRRYDGPAWMELPTYQPRNLTFSPTATEGRSEMKHNRDAGGPRDMFLGL
jgi:hypothetical protein